MLVREGEIKMFQYANYVIHYLVSNFISIGYSHRSI